MTTSYLQVAEDFEAEPMEMPTETDGSLLLSTLAAQFPGVSGLKFRNVETGGMRGVRLAEGRFHPPEKEGWGSHIYYCVLQKGEKKRKWEDRDEDGDKEASPNKRFESKFNQRCSDLIVLDLPWTTTEDEMREYFESFGDLILAQVKKNMKTGQSKGYGFIRFTNYESQIRVLGQRHCIQGRWCDVKIPNSKESQHSNVSPKVYVGRLTEDITEEDLREYFSKFGEVTQVYTPKPYRAFAFVTFMHADVAQSLCGEDHIIKGASVFISNAVPKTDVRDRNRDRNLNWHQDSYQNKDYALRDRGDIGRQGQGQGSPNTSIWSKTGGGVGRGSGSELSQITGNGSSNGHPALSNFNLPPQLNQAIVSAVLTQAVLGFVGSMQGQGQAHGQSQGHQQGGANGRQGQGQSQSSSSQSYGKQSSSASSYPTEQGAQGR